MELELHEESDSCVYKGLVINVVTGVVSVYNVSTKNEHPRPHENVHTFRRAISVPIGSVDTLSLEKLQRLLRQWTPSKDAPITHQDVGTTTVTLLMPARQLLIAARGKERRLPGSRKMELVSLFIYNLSRNREGLPSLETWTQADCSKTNRKEKIEDGTRNEETPFSSLVCE